jgi:hypothetical protein
MPELKIYTQDCGSYGSIIVIAKSEEQARTKMMDEHNYSENAEVEEHEINEDFTFSNYGSMYEWF